jgi:hypothetical protein
MSFPKGGHHTAETRAKMRASHLGLRQTPEAIAKSAMKRRGQRRSQLTRDAISRAGLGRRYDRVTCGECGDRIAVNALARHRCVRAGAYGVWRIFIKFNGAGPWSCYFCHHDVHQLGGCQPDSGMVHHIDKNTSNNARSNIVAAHHGCHTGYHNTERRKTK